MDETVHALKQYLQRHLGSGLVIIVGSGLSLAEGVPGMGALASHLASLNPADIEPTEWKQITEDISLVGLEAALKKRVIPQAITTYIRTETVRYLKPFEEQIIENVLSGKTILKLSRFLPYLKNDERVQIVTSNYDRLIELAAESIDYQVDTKSHGNYHAKFSRNSFPYAFCNSLRQVGKSWHRVEAKAVSLFKPHGSMDWRTVNGTAIRTGFSIPPEETLYVKNMLPLTLKVLKLFQLGIYKGLAERWCQK